MELKINLLKIKGKSTFRIIFGLVFFVLSIVWLGEKILHMEIIRFFDLLLIILFALNGIVHTIEGFGISIAQLFGKAFILINKEQIAVKTKIFKKEQRLYWDNIKSLNYQLNKFHIIDNSNNTLILDTSVLDYSLLIEIKEVMAIIAREKGISIT